MKKSFFRLLLCLCMAISLLTVHVSAENPKFTDVANDAYYAKPVAWAVEKGITSGTSATTFSPDKTCTNAEIITFMWNAAGKPKASLFGTYNPLFDVAENAYYYEAAKWALSEMILEDSYLRPDTKCTRGSTVEFLWKSAGWPSTDPIPYSDVKSGTQQETAVSWAVRNGLTAGTSDTTFSPDATVTRAQIVTFLYRLHVEPLDNSAIIDKAPKPAPSDSKLDPLPPENYLDGPAWYGTLTPVDKLSNYRLIEEIKRLDEAIADFDARGIPYTEPVYIRQSDLMYERKDRSHIISAYEFDIEMNWQNEGHRKAYQELIDKYGPVEPILEYNAVIYGN